MANYLSRPANAISIDVCDLQEIVTHQNTDDEIKTFCDRLKPNTVDKNEVVLRVITFSTTFFDENLRKSVFECLHNWDNSLYKNHKIKIVLAQDGQVNKHLL